MTVTASGFVHEHRANSCVNAEYWVNTRVNTPSIHLFKHAKTLACLMKWVAGVGVADK